MYTTLTSLRNARVQNSDGTGSKFFDPGWVGPKSTWVKDVSASYLLQVKSMLESGKGPSLVRKEERERSEVDVGGGLLIHF